MRVALAQINTWVGDLAGNVERCLAAIESARNQKADLVILPEMAIPGYPPRDILFDTSFTAAVAAATADLARLAAAGPPVVVGTLWPADQTLPYHPSLYNAAVLLSSSEVQLVAAKRLLPAYDVFHEPRWFRPGPPLPPVSIAGRRLGFLICEDMWDEGYPVHPPADLLAAGAEVLVCLSASPYRRQVLSERLYHARRPGCPLVYVNLCGATDELIFDGRSFVLNQAGEIMAQLAGFEEEIRMIDLDNDETTEKPQCNADQTEPPIEELHQALVLGVRDFARKNQLDRAFLGLSGGIDSALVAIIAAEALGPARVTAVAIPSRYTDPRSTMCAETLAGNLGIGFEVVDLETMHRAAEVTLGPLLDGGTTAENVQARLRGMILMSYVNRYGGMLLNTSNKTELSLGYATLYGDMAGTLCPIADVTKPQVIALARWLASTRHNLIPSFIVDRPPSAELRPDQVDPFDYAEVGPAIENLVQRQRTNAAFRRSEHKRWQMGVILKVSDKAFGTGRLIPITRR
ncbi:MAG: NAD+ synthase [Anaerolineaceae bacterium]|nr:NAD+ synthase [Anaerolineaceae bacterium]